MPFRLALAIVALYSLSMLLGSVYYYNAVQDKVIGSIDHTLKRQQMMIENLYVQFGPDGLVSLDNAESGPMKLNVGYHVASPKGAQLIGNIPQVQTEPGWATLKGNVLGLDSKETYRFLAFDVDGFLVSVGRSISETENLRKGSVTSFIIAFMGATLLALLGSAFLATRSHKRVSSIVNSMDVVARGNMSARLPISNKGDDIDSLSSNMNDAIELLQQHMLSMKNVSANIAHDLKTPLNRLNINIEEAAACVDDVHPASEKLDLAIEEAGNINQTFEALLRISQIEARSKKASYVEMDLVPALQNAHEIYEAVAEENGQNLTVQFEGAVGENSGLPMLGDKHLLLQMIVNLIENAIRYCPEGADIVISAGENRGQNWLSVCDNGPGIPESERSKVFERLYRMEASRTSKGAGLGLSMVKAIAELHCASIHLSDNEPGLCFLVKFDLDCPID